MGAVDDVVEIAAVFDPEALVERFADARRVLAVALRVRSIAEIAFPPRKQGEGVVPERVDLDRLPAPRRDDPILDLRVHPR